MPKRKTGIILLIAALVGVVAIRVSFRAEQSKWEDDRKAALEERKQVLMSQGSPQGRVPMTPMVHPSGGRALIPTRNVEKAKRAGWRLR